jgi:hypothetical protein
MAAATKRSKSTNMPNSNDNRMRWVRNLEAIAKAKQLYTVEYELGSEIHIPGLLVFEKGIICASMGIHPSRDGLFPYNLIVKYPLGANPPTPQADEKGYFFKDGVVGELIALFSLHFRCRFYLLSSRFVPHDPANSITLKEEYDFLYQKPDPAVHPPIFQEGKRNFASGLPEFLRSAAKLKTDRHQQFILASYHYARALKEVGIDSQMVFIRLVSAIEALSKDTPLKDKIDIQEHKDIKGLVKGSALRPEVKQELLNAFNVRGSKKRFVRFIQGHSAGFFKGGNFKAPHLKIKKSDLPTTLTTIYNARSAYLHAGEPMYLSMIVKGAGIRWDTDPTFGMTIDNRQFSAEQKLPYAFFFEGLVRHCLLHYIKANG